VNLLNLLTKRLDGSIEAVTSLRDQTDAISDMAKKIIDVLHQGGTLFTAGNGGSAAQAMHLSEELIGRYRGDRPPKRAICLNADPTALSCIANDYGYEQVFARQGSALLSDQDILLVLSTSGASENIIRALKVAREKGAVTLGLLGNDGGKCAEWCNQSIIIPARDSAHIQEAHQVVIHLLCEALEK